MQRGEVYEINGLNINRSTHGGTIAVALAEVARSNGRLIQLGAAYHGTVASTGGDGYVFFAKKFSSNFSGSFSSGREIIYVEGDSTIVFEPKMTLADFAVANSGNYLVVTAVLR